MKRLEKDGIYKNIEFAIQNILDICAMIVKNKGLQVPSSDDDVLTEIEDAHIMKKDVVEIIRKMKGFQNFLVHRYGVLNNRIAYNDIKTGLRDFMEVFKEIRKVII